jgi:hypothetical protein
MSESQDWQELTRLTGGRDLVIERVRLADSDIRIEGPFELPPLAKLTAEEQIFIAAFIQSHGSIKQMEQYFGISYPTVKNRLNRLCEKLHVMQVPMDAGPAERPPSQEILDRLEQGQISPEEAAQALERLP